MRSKRDSPGRAGTRIRTKTSHICSYTLHFLENRRSLVRSTPVNGKGTACGGCGGCGGFLRPLAPWGRPRPITSRPQSPNNLRHAHHRAQMKRGFLRTTLILTSSPKKRSADLKSRRDVEVAADGRTQLRYVYPTVTFVTSASNSIQLCT